jgi:hypothetical protein
MYINCDVLPLDLVDFRWKSQNQGLEALLISRDEFQLAECNKLFIKIYATVCAAFALEAHALDEQRNNSYLPIIPGLTETGYLEAEEMATYLLSLEKSQVLDVSVRLFASHGNPDLYIKECSGF